MTQQLINYVRNKELLKLIIRSPIMDDRWRKVTATTMPLVEHFPDKELIDYVKYQDGSGFVRLTDAGDLVAKYM